MMIYGKLYFEIRVPGFKIKIHSLIFSFGKPLPHYNDSEAKQIEQIRDTEEAGEEASR